MCVCACVCVCRRGNPPCSGCKQQPCLSLAAASTAAIATIAVGTQGKWDRETVLYSYLTAGPVIRHGRRLCRCDELLLKHWAWFTAITTIQDTIPLQQETWYLSPLSLLLTIVLDGSFCIKHLPNPLLATVEAAHSISILELGNLGTGDWGMDEDEEGKVWGRVSEY